MCDSELFTNRLLLFKCIHFEVDVPPFTLSLCVLFFIPKSRDAQIPASVLGLIHHSNTHAHSFM